MNTDLTFYKNLLLDIKNRVRQGQIKANISANAEMLATYWDIGKMIYERQQIEGWGKGVIPRLAVDLKNELSEIKGFSERNLKMMLTFYKEYPDVKLISQPSVVKLENNPNTKPSVSHLDENVISPLAVAKLENDTNSKTSVSKIDENTIVQLPVAQLQSIDNQTITCIGWTHHIILIQKIKDIDTREWYMEQIIEQGWSKETLITQIKNKVYERQGALVHNFNNTLADIHSNWAKQTFKDPYIFDFTTLATEYGERELELELVKNVEKFLLELGAGFAFVGRQYHLEVSNRDVYIDLLFYHLKMRCFVVIDLKKGEFLPEYAGKMNFYCSAVDDILKHETDKPTIGLILCQSKDKIFAEYTLRDIQKPIGISDYELTRALPENYKGSLPSIEEIENQFLNEF